VGRLLTARRGGTRGAPLMVALALLLLAGRGHRAESPDAATEAGDGRVEALVTRVVDGDTVEVSIGGQSEEIRYIGVDTPETVDPDEPVQCFGPQASSFNHRLVEGRRVELAFDAERRDKYGRLLAYVYLPDGRLVEAMLARQGLARTLTIPPNDSKAALFERLSRVAARRGRGLWGACGAAASL
jgi:micrococcal nuclease